MPWDRLESALPQHPAKEVSRTLRRLALAGRAAAEADCYPLFSCLAAGNGRVPSAATAALPFVVALAADRGMGARVSLVELLECLFRAAATAESHLVDEEWPAAWRRHQSAVQALLDPEPSTSVLEEFVLPIADGGDDYGAFGDALRALVRMGTVSPAARAALRTVRGFDRRLSTYRDYRAFLHDEDIRAVIEDALALP